MQRTANFFHALFAVIWTGVFAVLFTAVISGIWSALLIANLRTSAILPWSVGVMAVVLLGAITFLNGNWGFHKSQPARRTLLRMRAVPRGTLFIATLAGILALVALSGLWIVLIQTVKMQGNLSDFSRFPPLTVMSALLMAAISGAVSEEAGFRGYFQGALERYLPGWLAIAVAAALMIPEHASTQGFQWPTIVFYLLVDTMLGLTAYLTQSILPGMVIHAIGLVTFFGFIWPYDKFRPSIWVNGADQWFFLHAAQTIVFGLLAVLAYASLAKRRTARAGSRSRAGLDLSSLGNSLEVVS